MATIEFKENKIEFNVVPYVGETIGFDKNENEVGRGRDVPNIEKKVITKTKDYIEFSIKHNSNNPLVVSPGITYDYVASIWKSGSFHIAGSHDLAPNHELYLTSFPGDSASELYSKPIASFEHLFPTAGIIFPRGYFDISR